MSSDRRRLSLSFLLSLLLHGLLLSLTSLVSVLLALGHIVLVRRFPMQRKYLVASFGMLAFFGMDLSRLSPDISLWQLVPPPPAVPQPGTSLWPMMYERFAGTA